MTAPRGARTFIGMTKTTNPFRAPARIVTLLVLPIAAGVATLALAVLGENSWVVKGATEVNNGVPTVQVVTR